MRLALALALVLAASGCKKPRQAPAADPDPVIVVTPVPPPPPVATFDSTPSTPDDPAAPAPSTSGSSRAPKTTELEKAMEAAADGRSADVRRLLEKKVRAGHGSPEEVRLLRKACSSPSDKACLDDIKAKYP